MLEIQYGKKTIKIESVEDWLNFLNKYKPAEAFIDELVLGLPDEYFEAYVDEYLKIEL